MSRIRPSVVSVVALLALLAGCRVTNPDYAAWVRFEPGSYVIFEGERKIGDDVQPVRITEELIAKDAEHIYLKRTTGPAGDAGGEPRVAMRVEKARIDPIEDPRTHPKAMIRTLSTEDVEVAGRVFHCPVRELELHAQTEGFIGNVADIVGRAAVHPDMPGRFVKVKFRARTAHHEFEMWGRIVDFRAIRNQE